MAKNLGWVKLHRALAYNDLWLSDPFTKGQAWADLLMLAGRDGTLKVSYQWLTDRWKWKNKAKTYRFLKALEKREMIEFLGVTENVTENVTANVTAFRLINWEKFQHRVTANVTGSVTADVTLSENLLISSNKNINTRNIKQEPYSPKQRKKSRFLTVKEEHADLGNTDWMELDFSKEDDDGSGV